MIINIIIQKNHTITTTQTKSNQLIHLRTPQIGQQITSITFKIIPIILHSHKLL